MVVSFLRHAFRFIDPKVLNSVVISTPAHSDFLESRENGYLLLLDFVAHLFKNQKILIIDFDYWQKEKLLVMIIKFNLYLLTDDPNMTLVYTIFENIFTSKIPFYVYNNFKGSQITLTVSTPQVRKLWHINI